LVQRIRKVFAGTSFYPRLDEPQKSHRTAGSLPQILRYPKGFSTLRFLTGQISVFICDDELFNQKISSRLCCGVKNTEGDGLEGENDMSPSI
jgi:hypothetical protein